jgi:hypothetical protein
MKLKSSTTTLKQSSSPRNKPLVHQRRQQMKATSEAVRFLVPKDKTEADSTVVFEVVQLLKQSAAAKTTAQGHGSFIGFFCGSTDFGVSKFPVGPRVRCNIFHYCTVRLLPSDGGVSSALLFIGDRGH